MRNLRSILLLAMTAAAMAPSAARAAAAGPCPGDSPPAQARVRDFLSAPHLAAVREQLGLAAATPRGLRALAGQQDEAACRSLRDALAADRGQVPPGHLAFYESGGFYFSAVTRPSAAPGAGAARIREDSSVLFVFDRQFRLVSRLLA